MLLSLVTLNDVEPWVNVGIIFSSERFKYFNPVCLFTMKFKGIIPKNVDPVKLADEIKGDLTTEFLKRMKRVEPRLPLALKS